MTKRTYQYRLDQCAWQDIRKLTPGLNDPERSRRIQKMLRNIKNVENMIGMRFM